MRVGTQDTNNTSKDQLPSSHPVPQQWEQLPLHNPCAFPIKKNIAWPFKDYGHAPFCPTGDLLVELGVAVAMWEGP